MVELITAVIQMYYTDWQPPAHGKHEWRKCQCPFHGDVHASAAVSFERNAFRCHACPVRGDAYSIVASQEGISYRQAIEFTTEALGGSYSPVSPVAARKSGRRLFGGSRSFSEQPRGSEVPSRVRRRVFGRP